MTRIEIISNRSVQTDIVETLEANIEDFFYTILPVVHGRGKQRRKLGTAIWPEENFMLVAYADDAAAERARGVVAEIKKRFPNEGIKLFTLSEKT